MYHIKEADVVIVGAGAAGTMSAVYARRTNPHLKIVVLDKSKMETSGAAGRGMDALNMMSLPPYSSPEDVVELLTKITEGVLDQEVAYVFGKRCPQVVQDLEKIMQREKGDLFPIDENGNYRLYYLQPIQKPLLQPMDGEEMKRALAKAVRDAGAEIYERTSAIKITTENNQVTGVLAFNSRSGEYVYFKTRAVCLVAGCAGRMGLPSSGYLAGCYEFPGNAGDGYALAYDAGAELVNMECFQATHLLKDYEGPACGYVAAPRGGKGTDHYGNSFGGHSYGSGDGKLATWMVFAEGRGPTHLQMSHLPEKTIKVIEKIQFGNERTSRMIFHKQRGEDYLQRNAIEQAFGEEIVACGGHSSCGVLSDVNGACNVLGLYVAGDVDAGLPYSNLGGALAMGGLIGERAAEYAGKLKSRPEQPSLKSWISEEMKKFEEPLLRDKGLPTEMVEYKARARVQYYLKPPKSPGYMERAIWWMNQIREKDLCEVKAVDYHDLLKVYEIGCILTVGEMMAKASLFREESRWGYHHWRSDIPMKKAEWEGQWVVIKKGSEGMELSKRAVPARKWDFPIAMEYAYPTLSYDIGQPFQKGPNWIKS
jgi:succinate dehydrogenase/fumarate reductase flavoprotein subunit